MLPDYKNSIVNVSSSILNSFNLKILYSPLKELNEIKNYDNVILLIIDGLGNEYLKKYGKNSFLNKNFVKTITSVFPSTTCVATTSLETGVAPQQHAVMGWFMFLKEYKTIFAPWTFQSRIYQDRIKNIKREEVFLERRITDKINPSFLIYGKDMGEREINKNYSKLKSYNSIDEIVQYVKTHLEYCCNIYPSKYLIQNNFFGLFKPNKKLQSRIGDYVLIAKENYTFKDWLPHEKKFYLKGVHGGLSKEEMAVPLILLKIN